MRSNTPGVILRTRADRAVLRLWSPAHLPPGAAHRSFSEAAAARASRSASHVHNPCAAAATPAPQDAFCPAGALDALVLKFERYCGRQVQASVDPYPSGHFT